MKLKKTWGLVYSALFLASCTAGPDYHQPDMKLDATFHNGPASQQANEDPVNTFWTGFNDPVLNQLVEAALKANPEVKVAMANLQAVRAQEKGVDAEFWPVIGVHASPSKSVISQTFMPGDRTDRTHTVYETGVDMSWEANLFGRFSRAKEMAVALTSAEEAGIHAAQVSVTAEIAHNYFQLRGFQAQFDLAKDTVKNLEAVLEVAKTRQRLGRSGALEVAQVRALLEGTRASIPDLAGAIERTRYHLARLTGQVPTALDALLATTQPLPGLPVLGQVGTPASLLRRRPDVRQAERRLAAATANIGVNTSELFPTVSFTGMLGLNAGRLDALTNSQAFIYNLGASIVWTALDFGRIRSRIEGSKAQANAALAVYEGTVLTALEETESALVTFTRSAQQTEHLFNALKASEESTRITRLKFDAGAADVMMVLDAERLRLADQAHLSQSQTGTATALISVYKALGGGWSVSGEATKQHKASLN